MKRHILFGFLLLSMLLSGCSREGTLPVSMTKDGLLGTIITLSVYDAGEDSQNLLSGCFEKISDIDSRMTVRSPGGEINALNDSAGANPIKVSGDIYRLFSLALDVSKTSDGAFDVTVGPLVRLWGIGTADERVPERSEIEAARGLVSWQDVLQDESEGSVFLKREGMLADLGGIAKGYAGDAASDFLRENGVRRAVLDLGGNICLIGSRPDGTGWRVGVRNPVVGESGNIGTLRLEDTSVVTSGGYERYFEKDGKIYHHILDPKTGYPADSGLLSATIVCKTSALADALSTACFVLGVKKGAKLAESYGAEYVFVTDGREIIVSRGLSDVFTLRDESFTVRPPLQGGGEETS